MFLLIAFAFLAGIVTVLSPCILPLLPIILSSAHGGSKQRPIGVVVGFISSFTFFTLFLSIIVKFSGIPADSLRFLSILILAAFGASLLIPKFQTLVESLFSSLASLAPNGQKHTGFTGGIIIGLSLGLLWTPCVGPILASVISLAITGSVNSQALFITLSYAAGTAIPMFIIMSLGSTALQKIPFLAKNTHRIQKIFGVLMILTSLGIYLNLDRRFQTFILSSFPNYGVGLTQFEDTQAIKNELSKINQKPIQPDMVGKPLLDITQPNSNLAPEIISGGQWFNSAPLQLGQLRGQVVLVDFWTYSCINCQRTLPYLRDWWAKYQDKGLVIIGVHSPEFEFEKQAKNVEQAVSDFGLKYPVVQDNEFATWRAYSNHYWPAKYLIDKEGVIRYTHFGEGRYDETEAMIQKLLTETGSQVSTQKISNPEYEIYSKTPELYLGHARIEYLVSPETILPDKAQTYSLPKTFPANSFAYTGDWTILPEYASPQVGATLYLKFNAKDVYLVARPKSQSGTIKIFLDNQLQLNELVNQSGIITVDSDSLYHLISLPTPGQHELRIEFQDDNLEVYAFTFG